jgi:hypothetical protein
VSTKKRFFQFLTTPPCFVMKPEKMAPGISHALVSDFWGKNASEKE